MCNEINLRDQSCFHVADQSPHATEKTEGLPVDQQGDGVVRGRGLVEKAVGAPVERQRHGVEHVHHQAQGEVGGAELGSDQRERNKTVNNTLWEITQDEKKK